MFFKVLASQRMRKAPVALGLAAYAIFVVALAQPSPLHAQVCSGNITLSSQAEVDAFNCTQVTGSLVISGSDIVRLSGLGRLTSVEGALVISSTALTSLQGFLWNLTSVGGLSIDSNAALTSTSGLVLTSVRGDVTISNNPALTDLHGLLGLTSIPGWLDIVNNAKLNSDGLYGLIRLTSIGNGLTIRQSPALTNLDVLYNLVSVGSLDITQNAALTNVSALSRLTSVGSLLIQSNAALTSLNGLSRLTSVGDVVNIFNNPALTSIGLLSLNSIGGSLFIRTNAALRDLDGLSRLTSVGLSLVIARNMGLTSIDGLSSLTSVGGSLSISNNPALTLCCGLFPLLSGGGVGGTISIANNGLGCTKTEILSSPVISCPDDVSLVTATGQATYSGPAATATGNCDPNPTVTSDPVLPATFGLGVHTITYTATDVGNQSSQCVQTVTVITPVDAIHNLIALVQAFLGDDWGLIRKLEEAITALGRAKTNAAVNKLQDFVDQVAARVNSGALSQEQGDELTAKAVEIITALAGDHAAKTQVPTVFALGQNVPNPFNPTTTIRLSLPAASAYTLSIHDVAGRVVRRYEGTSEPGQVSIVWDGTDETGNRVGSGIYFYKVQAGDFAETRRMVLLK